MKAATAPPIFSATATHSVPPVALVSISVSARATFTEARCSARHPKEPTRACNRLVMAIPGVVTLHVQSVASNAHRSGRGRVVNCPRCGALLEVIEHR